MLRKISKSEYDSFLDFVYGLTADLAHSSFPVYNDGVKTKEFFCEKSLKGLDNDEEEILLFENNGQAEGWIHYYRIDSDKYLGINSMLIKNGYEKALSELFDYWNLKYSGYMWALYFPEENKDALHFMEKKGLSVSSGDVVDVLLFKDYTPQAEGENIVQITYDNFEIFRSMHSRFDSEMYWSCDRIKESLERWEIFAYIENGQCKGVLYYIVNKNNADLEIFGIDYFEDKFDHDVTEKLLISGLNKAKAANARSMYFFNDKITHKITERLGFRYITTAHYFEGRF